MFILILFFLTLFLSSPAAELSADCIERSYFLKNEEALFWKKTSYEAILEKETLCSGSYSSELIYDELPNFSLKSILSRTASTLVQGTQPHVLSGHHYPLQLSDKKISLSTEGEKATKVTFIYKASLQELVENGVEWPPKNISIYLTENSPLFLYVTLKAGKRSGEASLYSLYCSSKEFDCDLNHNDLPLPEIIFQGTTATFFLSEKDPTKRLLLSCLNSSFQNGSAPPLYRIRGEKITFCLPIRRENSLEKSYGVSSSSRGLLQAKGLADKDKVKIKKTRSQSVFESPLITRYTDNDRVEKLHQLAAEFVWEQNYYCSSNSASRYQENNFSIILCKRGNSSAYLRSPTISPEVWEKMKPFFLPETHPLRGKLDRLFSRRVIATQRTLKKAGFLTPEPRPFSHSIVTKHKHIKGYIFKMFTDEQNLNDARLLLTRIMGAKATRMSIERLGWSSMLAVPSKWIYPLPPSKTTGPYKKHFILIAKGMNIYTGERNRNMWFNRMTPQLLRGIYSIVTDVGLSDSLIPSNIPFLRDGGTTGLQVVVFIDTEHFNSRPIPYYKIVPYLNPAMEKAWKKLVDKQKVTSLNSR